MNDSRSGYHERAEAGEEASAGEDGHVYVSKSCVNLDSLPELGFTFHSLHFGTLPRFDLSHRLPQPRQ